jgi:eukaryotic-like serine/threonine-protein kinase
MILDLLKVPALVAGLLAVSLGGILVVKRSHVAESTPAAIAPSSPSAFNPTLQAGFVPKVEIPWKPLDSTAGAEPSEAQPPAPTRIAMLRKDNENLKIEETPVPRKKRGLRSLVGKCVGAACCAMLAGCPSPQVRPTPPPEACPQGAVETMKELGIEIDAKESIQFGLQTKPITVQEGFTSVTLGRSLGELKGGTVLQGRLIFGDTRVYGRFTEAHTPGGKTFPICLELAPSVGRERGVEMESNGRPGTAVIFPVQAVRAVRRFE